MYRALLSGYVFDPANRRIDFGNMPGFDARCVRAVIHLLTGEPLYALARTDLAPASINGAVLTFSLQVDTAAMNANQPLVVIYEDDVLPATDARLEAVRALIATGNASLSSILAAIQAQRTETIWTDDTGTRFIRTDAGGVISWTNVAGAASAPPGAGARPDSDSGLVVSRSTYRATAAGTGFAIGDFLDHLVVTDGDAGDLISNFWVNATAGAKIAAPNAASITPLAPLPDGAATAARQDTGNTALAAVQTGIGAPGDLDPGTDAAAGSIIARLARLLASTTGLGTLLAAIRDRLPAALDGGRLAVKAASLPLPDGAASAALQAGAVLFADATQAVVPSNSTTGPVAHAVPASPQPYTRFNVAGRADYAGNLIVQGSNDSFVAQAVGLDTVALTGGAPAVTKSYPLIFAAYRAYYQNTSGNQGYATIASSFTRA